jgi:release factor glutamine methyltransferase
VTVYRPGEDTFLVLEHLEGLELKGKKFLDMGTGNGEIALKAAEKGAKVVAVDINPEALSYAMEKAEVKDLEDRVTFVESDLFENVQEEFDFVVFNPPYLPGEEGLGDEEIWRGGEKGIEVTERFLKRVPEFLAEGGEAFIVISSRSEIENIVDSFGLSAVSSKKIWFEELKLFRFD